MKKLFLLFLITNMTAATLTGQVMMLFSSDPASGITSPLDVDSLFYWYAADVGVTTNNNKVTQWNDLSGNGHHVTQADTSKAPTYSATGGPNSRPTMTFDGTDDFLASAAHFWGSDDLTVIVVMKFGNATRDVQEIFLARGITSGSRAQWNFRGLNDQPGTTSDYRFRFFYFKDGGVTNFTHQTNVSGSTKSTSYKTYSHVGNVGTAQNIFINGASEAYTAVVTGTGDNTIYDNADPGIVIGAIDETAPSNFFQGSISEIIVYSRALTTAERSGLEQNYLCKKYGLACP
jgi:hypothetical protein